MSFVVTPLALVSCVLPTSLAEAVLTAAHWCFCIGAILNIWRAVLGQLEFAATALVDFCVSQSRHRLFYSHHVAGLARLGFDLPLTAVTQTASHPVQANFKSRL